MEISNITMRRGSRLLVRGGSLSIREGEITLLLGGSGSGKSTLLYGLADLDPAVSMSCDQGTQPLENFSIGLVPQNSAPFEELRTCKRNVSFAHAHCLSRSRNFEDVWGDLSTALGLGEDWKFPLSGGQSQRTAIARALASGAKILLCDEPTSGLDPAGKEKVIQLFQAVADEGVAVLIVSHDTEWKRPGVADKTYVLDDCYVRAVGEGDETSKNRLEENRKLSASIEGELPRMFRPFRSVGRSCWWFLMLPVALWNSLFSSKRIRLWWFLQFTWGFILRLLGPSSWIYLSISGYLLGFAVFFFSVSSLRVAPHLETLLVPELVSGSGFGLYRVIIPLVACLLVAAKSGSALAAEYGNRQYGKQIDVFRSIGAPPEGYLLLPAVLALGVGLPVLFLISFLSASLGSLTAFIVSYPMQSLFAWREDFFRLLTESDSGWWIGTGWNLAKTSLAGVGIAVVSYRFGTLPKKDSGEIGMHISSATLWSSLWSLCVFAIVAIFEFII